MIALSNVKCVAAFNSRQTIGSTMTRQDSFLLISDELWALVRCD